MRYPLAKFIGALGVTCAIGVAVDAQTPAQGNPFFFFNQEQIDATVRNAPYSGEGTTRVKLVMYDGTHIDQSVTAKFYRDSAGRVRREQAIIGIEALDPAADVQAVIQIVDPVSRAIYTINPGSKTATRLSMDDTKPGLTPKTRLPGPINMQELGSRTIEGLAATGRRVVTTIPAGRMGNDRAIEIIDENWMSTDLKVLLQSLHRDPRTGDVEYALTKISREEPPASLFSVPAGYEIHRVDTGGR